MKSQALWGIFGIGLALPLWAVQGTLQPLKGTVSVQASGDASWVYVKKSMAVEEGARIQTGADSSAFLVTPDDHRVMIGPNSYLTLQRLASGETKLFLKEGSVRNKVRKLETDLGQFYKLQTPTAVVAVRGTDFSVVQGEMARVNVFEGIVDLSALRAELAKETQQLKAGEFAVMDPQGRVEQKPIPQEGQRAPQKNQPDSKEPKGPPPPGGPPAGGMPGSGPTGPNWWDHPDKTGSQPSFFGDSRPLNPPPPTTFGSVPPPLYQPPPIGQPPVPPGGSTGGTYPGNGVEVGLNALVDTMRSKNLHAQADAILVADLYQRREVAMDPLTGQLRQYADAIVKAGPDAIRFVNATMIAGVPDTLNYTNTLTRFNTALPTNYWDATKQAFDSLSTTPAYWATEYHSDISNTVDHMNVDASGGSPVADVDGSFVEFANMSTRINGTTLWSKSGSVYTFLGGAAPSLLSNPTNTGRADSELKNQYANGTYVSVRTLFSDMNGHVPTMADVPSAGSPAAFLESLNTRVLIRSNLLTRGSLDIFGSARGMRLSGMMRWDDSTATEILNGREIPEGAPLGLYPFPG